MCRIFVHSTSEYTFNPLRTEFILNSIYKNSVRTSQEAHYVSTTKPNRLMLFGETVAVYFENHTEHTHCVGKMESFVMLKWVVLIVTTGL
jgi:hypothetical protein